MLNYIWVGLVIIGILVAVGNDIRDEVVNPYRNGVPMDARFEVRKAPADSVGSWEGDLVIAADAFNAFYTTAVTTTEVRQPVSISVGEGTASSLLMGIGDGAPAVWRTMARYATSKDNLSGTVQSLALSEDRKSGAVRFILEPIRFIKLKAVTQAALDYALTAVNIALGLIGVMALWLGVMKVAEAAGLLLVVTRMLRPLTRLLFPEVPPDHPAVGAIVMNIAANMLGLSNAATPMGLKAMEELNKLNPRLGTATNAMVTFLAINTGGLILIPATAMAVRAASGSANPGIIIGTSIVGAGCATIAGVLAAKILERLPAYRKSVEVGHD